MASSGSIKGNPENADLIEDQDSRQSSQDPSLVETRSFAHPVEPNQDTLTITPAEYLADLKKRQLAGSPDEEDSSAESDALEGSRTSSPTYQDLRTGLCYDARMRFHYSMFSNNHQPEDPRRILAIYKKLCQHGLVENPACEPLTGLVQRPLRRIPARHAQRNEILTFHTGNHFDIIHQTEDAHEEVLKALNLAVNEEKASLYYNNDTYSAALLSAGSAIDTSLAVARGEVRNAFAVIRPPGHHAEASESGGFCFFNNVAVAVRNTQLQCPEIKRVMVVDWDVHHGNGIQQAFYADPNVLYISLHRYDDGNYYPGGPAGAITSDGEGAGRGKNINIGWHGKGRTDGDYLMAFQHIIMPVAQEFDPDMVVIASGFDAADGDTLGECHVTAPCYAQMTHMLMSLANGKVVVCLEGGYNLKAIANASLAVTQTLMGQPPPRITHATATMSGSRTVFEVINYHSRYWRSLAPKSDVRPLGAFADAIRVHDLVRSHQADQYFQDHRMHSLPIRRDKAKELQSKTFEKQALATRGFRTSNDLLIIFHDTPEMGGGVDYTTGKTLPAKSEVYDVAQPFVKWAVGRGFGVIDVNLPDHYTGISSDGDETVREQNRIISRIQLCVAADYIWQNYVAQFQGTNIVMLGIGNAFYAAQRIFATHSKGDMDKHNVRAVGVIQDEVPGAPPSESMEHFEHYYHKWTTIWVPKDNKIFFGAKNGVPKRRYGGIRASSTHGLTNLVKKHEAEIRNTILQHFNLSPEASPAEGDGADNGSERVERSVLGKRTRDIDDVGINSVDPRGIEER